MYHTNVFLPLAVFHRVINVSIPTKTRNNGTLYALIFVHQAGVSPWQDPREVHLVAHLTTYMVPKPPEISLISMDEQAEVTEGHIFTFLLLCNIAATAQHIIWSSVILLILHRPAGAEGRRKAKEKAWHKTSIRRRSRWSSCFRPPNFPLALPPYAQHRSWSLPVWQNTPACRCPQIPESVRDNFKGSLSYVWIMCK